MSLPRKAPLIFYTLAQSTNVAQPVLSGLTPLDSSRGVRVVKDVLRVGTWKAGQRDWVVTDDTLTTLSNDFAAMKANGVPCNLYWGSRPDGGPGGQHAVEAKNAIAPIDQVFTQDGVLYCSSYMTAEQAKQLENPAHQVSVGVQPDWTAGDKTKYALALLHVAIVDQPVVTGQGPFLTLSNESLEDEDEMTPELKATLEGQTAVIAKLTESFMGLSNEFLAFKADTVAKKANEAKDAWSGKLKGLFDGKKINAATLKQYEELGSVVAYNLAILAPLDGLIMLASESGVQGLANAGEPDIGGDKGMTDAEAAAIVKARGHVPLS